MHGNFQQHLKNNYSVSSEGKGIFLPPNGTTNMPVHVCTHCTRVHSVWRSRVWPRTLVCLAPPSTEFSSNNTGGGCQLLLHGIFLPPGSNPHRLCLPRRQLDSLPVSHLGSPTCQYQEHSGVRRVCVWVLGTVLSMTLKRSYVACH